MKRTCDCAAACRRTAQALEGAAMQPNAWRRIAQESPVNGLHFSPSGLCIEGGCCKATAARSMGRGVRRSGAVSGRPLHLPFSGGVVKGKLLVGRNGLAGDQHYFRAAALQRAPFYVNRSGETAADPRTSFLALPLKSSVLHACAVCSSYAHAMNTSTWRRRTTMWQLGLHE